MVDQTTTAQALDALGERAYGDGIARHGDGNLPDRLLAVVMEADGGVEHAVGERRIAAEALCAWRTSSAAM